MKSRKIFYRYISGYKIYFPTLIKYGFKGLILELKNRSLIWSIRDRSVGPQRKIIYRTSISHVKEYLDICEFACNSQEVLNNFKNCHEYKLVLEHVNRIQGEEYLNLIQDDTILDSIRYVSMHEIGNPFRYPYRGIGYCSPTQLRYGKILSDIKSKFDTSKFRNVVEIGVGTGGLAAQITHNLKVSSYVLVDLPAVIDLTKRVLKPFSMQTNFEYVYSDKFKEGSYDFFLSNYAFSELVKEVQDFYIEKYISRASSGFMLYNHIHKNSSSSYTANEMLEKIPGSKIYPEVPKTFKNNVLLIWGENSN